MRLGGPRGEGGGGARVSKWARRAFFRYPSSGNLLRFWESATKRCDGSFPRALRTVLKFYR